MQTKDFLLLAMVYLISTALYTSILFWRQNRTIRGLRSFCFGAAVSLFGCTTIWYTVFVGPLARNWGLGGSYLWLAVCPIEYLVCGIAVTICSCRRENKRRSNT